MQHSETTPQPIDSYSIDDNQCAPWKKWAMSELVRQKLIGQTVSSYQNTSSTDGLSDYAKHIVENVVLDDVSNPIAVVWNLTDFQLATKGNPLERILEAAKEVGCGAEAASLGELVMALKVHPAHNIMFDSPCKTINDIKYALQSGVGLTLDNFQEIVRVDALLSSLNIDKQTIKQPIGLRLNPQIGLGQLSTYSVSKPYSKFGTPITELYNDVKSMYISRPYLNMIHVHAGSQSYDMEQISTAIRRVVDLVLDINKTVGYQQITTIDIGGGLCTNFSTEDNTPSLYDYATILRKNIPELFTGEYKVITELSRRLLAKQGFIVSQIEYIKTAGERRVILQHVGADIGVRTVYKPASWPLRVTLFNKYDGTPIPPASSSSFITPDMVKEQYRSNDTCTTINEIQCDEPNKLYYADIAGPCCIDDVLAPSLRPLPPCQQGDWVLLHDTGAYYHSAYSYYNMRQTPVLYCFYEPADRTTGELTFECIRPMGTVQETVDFFTTIKQ